MLCLFSKTVCFYFLFLFKFLIVICLSLLLRIYLDRNSLNWALQLENLWYMGRDIIILEYIRLDKSVLCVSFWEQIIVIVSKQKWELMPLYSDSDFIGSVKTHCYTSVFV